MPSLAISIGGATSFRFSQCASRTSTQDSFSVSAVAPRADLHQSEQSARVEAGAELVYVRRSSFSCTPRIRGGMSAIHLVRFYARDVMPIWSATFRLSSAV